MTDYVQQIYDFLFVKIKYGYFFFLLSNHAIILKTGWYKYPTLYAFLSFSCKVLRYTFVCKRIMTNNFSI